MGIFYVYVRVISSFFIAVSGGALKPTYSDLVRILSSVGLSCSKRDFEKLVSSLTSGGIESLSALCFTHKIVFIVQSKTSMSTAHKVVNLMILKAKIYKFLNKNKSKNGEI